MRILHNVYEHDFGLLVPCKSGVVWEHQTDGVMCHHIFIEGIFLPLPRPYGNPPQSSGTPRVLEPINLLLQLTQANYKHNKAELRRVWLEINRSLFFSYKRTEAPKGQPPNQEGVQWIKITGIKKVIDGEKLEEHEKNKRNYGGLLGKNIALIYPNCD